ncbi:CDP-alcohol phosphatidyltransferase family protein [Marinilabiliaceae bacterium ANBcel2]|nr:CDP-alcohol phosphatidyltransferase family protein [Marinilabiliaceae bacterium ANBcel2]
MSFLRFIPNLLTLTNLFLGVVAIYFALNGRPDLSAWAIVVAAVFDFSDGFAARLFNAYSDIGKDLDSLADLISFGLAPTAVYSSIIFYGLTGSWSGDFFELSTIYKIFMLSPVILTLFSALRLAKFNNDERQSENFIGLTTTSSGMFAASFGYLAYNYFESGTFIFSPFFIIGLVLIFSALIVSELPMFSLKFKNLDFKENLSRYIIIAISLVSLIFFSVGAFALIIPVYIFYSSLVALICRR